MIENDDKKRIISWIFGEIVFEDLINSLLMKRDNNRKYFHFKLK